MLRGAPTSTLRSMGERIGLAVLGMMEFAERTGIAGEEGLPDALANRYLWTDAFAVCNLLGLARASGDARLGEIALRLVDRVHRVLGRHRPDDARRGWISGLAEGEGAAHPTRGGLRIGKSLPERAAGAPFDERLEWDRDGQYFHYLAKWAHALDAVARATGRGEPRQQAAELMLAAHRGFVRVDGAGRRMAWKMSIDLSRPLVDSMGQHDPLDGLLAIAWLGDVPGVPAPALGAAAAEFAAMVDVRRLATPDPLGIGGLLGDAFRAMQLRGDGRLPGDLPEVLLQAALAGLEHWAAQPDLRRPTGGRLAFRELGLAIGLAAVEPERWAAAGGGASPAFDALARFRALRGAIEETWIEPAARRGASWREHENINEVMLATALEPDGFLVRRPPPAAASALP